VILLLLGGIFIFAAYQRFSLPIWPVADPDTWGYLNPALSWLAGKGLQQTFGRDFLYPVFLLLVLKTTHTFSAIVVVQHLLGLLSGVVWWGIWSAWSRWLPDGIARRFVAPLCGLGGLALYLWGGRTVMFEMQLRPEAIFPLVALVQIAAMLGYARARWKGGTAPAICLWGALAMWAAIAAQNLKPSWGLAFLAAPLLLVIGLFGRGFPPLRARVIPLLVGLLGVAFFVQGLPRAIAWKTDQDSRTFFPTILFAIHANIMADHIRHEIASGRGLPGESRFLEDLDRGIREGAGEGNNYKLIGFNADYLVYDSPSLANAPVPDNPDARRKYFMGTYLAALKSRPLDFAGKWAKQFAAVYIPKRTWIYWPKIEIRGNYVTGVRSLDAYREAPLPTPYDAVYAGYRSLVRELAASGPTSFSIAPDPLLDFAGVLAYILLPGVLFSLVLAAASFIRSPLPGWGTLGEAARCSMIAVSCSLGAVGTVALVHSFDINRYGYILAFLHLMLITSALALAAAMIELVVRRYFARHG